MSVSDGITATCKAWDCLYQPVADRILILRSLPSRAAELSREAKAIGELKDDVTARVRGLLESDQRLEQSSEATGWLCSVETLLDSCTGFRTKFEARPSNCMGFGCYKNYELAKEAEDLLKQARDFKDQGSNFSADRLANQAPEMVIVRRNLEANAENLSRELRMLRCLRADKDARVKSLVSQRQETLRSEQARAWFEELDSVIESISRALAGYSATARSGSSHSSTSSCCFSAPEACDACIHGFELGKEMIRLLRDGGRLREQGSSFTDDQLVVAAPPASREEIPIYFRVVGQKKELDDALRFIDDASGVRGNVVGIWGMGGCGKTTLLKRINNHFCSRTMDGCGFDVILYTTAGRDWSVAKMQKEMGKRLGLSLSETGGAEEEQKRQIFRSLQTVSFLLLLDDLWEEMDLEKLGVPPLKSNTQKKRKMVITSRNADVCSRMSTEQRCLIEVGLLSVEESWQVFSECVGSEELLQNPRIAPLARDMADQCGQLPLALVTIGKAMAGATEEHEWRNARLELRQSAHQDMNKKVLSQLKFSFDKLKNDNMREIMFFCQDVMGVNRHMYTVGLARLIVAEGLLDGVCHGSNLASALDMAQTLIVSLVKSGLLMWYGRKRLKVTLHDCVHDMLAWLMDSEEDKRPRMVRWPSSLDDYSTSRQLQLFFQTWENARRISMDGSRLKEIPENTEMPSCTSLLHLSWSKGKIVRLPDDFFHHMPFVRILNLVDSDIDEVPASIGSLANLKFLSLRSTNITRLPIQIGDLQHLVELYLSHTSKLKDIPYESISRLLRLEILGITHSAFRWTWWDKNSSCNNGGDHGNRNFALQDLHELSKLGVLTEINLCLEISNRVDLNKLADSPKLLNAIIGLELKNNCKDSLGIGETIAFIITKMERLKQLLLCNLDLSMLEKESCPVSSQQQGLHVDSRGHGTSYVLPALEGLSIANCLGLCNLEWTRHIPSLQQFWVSSCENLNSLFPLKGEKVLEYGNGRFNSFTNLRRIYLEDCPKLNCISKSPLLFPSLEKLYVKGCPELRNLYFEEQSAPRLRKIEGSTKWWNNLEWENEKVKSRFLHCYYELA